MTQLWASYLLFSVLEKWIRKDHQHQDNWLTHDHSDNVSFLFLVVFGPGHVLGVIAENHAASAH